MMLCCKHFVLLCVVICSSWAQLRPGGNHVCQRTVTYNVYESRRLSRVGYDNYRTCCRRVLRVCTSRCTRYRSHVCQRTVTYNVYESKRFSRVGYDNYRTCCRRVFGVCTNRCTRTRSKVVYYTNSVLVQKQRVQYYCCQGWAKSGDQCPLPICNPGCKNGRCTNPNQCTCNSGYNGNLCENDINECSRKPCSQVCTNLPGSFSCSCRTGFIKTQQNDPKSPTCKDVDECSKSPCKCATGNPSCVSSCRNTVGSFSCSCNSGYKLTSSKTTCIDIDECASSTTHKCQQKCVNNRGSYICACNSGYLLQPDKRTCQDINECNTLNGGCNQICTNKPGSYQCSCKRGFRLSSDKKTCVDINECTEQKPCDRRNGICTNIRGSYQCSCKVGYKMLPDKKTCKDINECADLKSQRCQQNCTNTDGSYICFCKAGYRLDNDKHKCNDIDECFESADHCQHNCHNNIGSYSCTCRNGYKLKNDQLSCQALPCQTIASPSHGNITCSGFVTDETCNVTCVLGFNLLGPDSRTCLASTDWSGNKPSCEKKRCPQLLPPAYGSVLLPCNELFDNTCLKKCSKGHYMSGSISAKCVIKNGNTTWTNENTTCRPSTPCQPNLCLNNGKCSEVSQNSFSCDCTGTGFTGDICATGLVTTPVYPQLTRNVTSQSFTIEAKPDDFLQIQLSTSTDNVEFSPRVLSIRFPDTTAQFTVLAKQAGSFDITYSLSGRSSYLFKVPESSRIYVFDIKKEEHFPNITINFYQKSCHRTKLTESVSVVSTCSFDSSGATAGFLSVSKDNATFPVSITGLSRSPKALLSEIGLVNPIVEIQSYLESKKLSQCTESCDDTVLNTAEVDYIIRNRFFPYIYAHEFSSLLPFWMEVSLASDAKPFLPNDLQSLVAVPNALKEIGVCLQGNVTLAQNGVYSVYVPSANNMKLQFTSKQSTRKLLQSCFLVNLEGNEIGINMVGPLDYTKNLNTFGVMVTRFKLFNIHAVAHIGRVRAVLDYKFKSFVGILKFDGVFNVNDAAKLAMKVFSAFNHITFVGNLKVKLESQFLGKTLSIDAQFLSNATITINGSYSRISMHMPLIDSSFKYSLSSIRFHPKEISTITTPFILDGGAMKSIQNVNQLKLTLRTIDFIKNAKNNLERILLKDFPGIAEILQQRSHGLFSSKDEVLKLLTTAPINERNVIVSVRKLKKHFFDMSSFIHAVRSKFVGNTSASFIVKTCDAISGMLKNQEQRISIELSYMPVVFRDISGWKMSYTGDLCVYSLCFENLNVQVDDLANDKFNAVKIKAFFRSNQNLTSRLSISRNDLFEMNVDRNSNKFIGSFAAKLTLFKQQLPVKVIISDSKFQISAMVSLDSNLMFNVSIDKDIAKISWGDVISTVYGVSDGPGSNIQSFAQSFFAKTAVSTKGRLNKVKERKQETSFRYLKLNQNTQEMKAKLDEAKKLYRIAEATYKVNLLQLNNSEIQMQSYLKNGGALFIEKNLTRICLLQSCKKECLAMPECQICQDPINIGVDLMKCTQTIENIKSSAMVPVNTMCELTKYFFFPIYTGDCGEDPSVADYKSRQMKEYMGTVSRASAVGSLIGSVIPGVGTAIGGIIGAVVGFIGGLFSSCSDSYEVVTKKKIIQSPCTQLVLKVQTVKRPKSTCFYEKTNVQSGYSEPKECNCQLNRCISKVANSNCLVTNANCRRKRNLFLKSVKVPKAYKKLYDLIQNDKEYVESSFTDIQRIKQRRDFLQHEYTRLFHAAQNAEQESKFANKTEENIHNLLANDLCLNALYDKYSNISNFFEIRNIKFESNLPFIDNLQMMTHVYVKSTNILKSIPFIYTFQDGELSLQTGAKKIVYQTLCAHSRKRRSLGNEIDDDDERSFKSWYIDKELNATTIQLACMTVKRTTTFLKHTAHILLNLTQQTISLSRYINQSSEALSRQKVSLIDNSTKSVANLFLSTRDELNAYANRSTLSYVLSQWIESSEIYSSENNFTICYGFQDCADIAFESLKSLPTVFTIPRTSYLNHLNVMEDMWKSLFVKTGNNSSLVDVVNDVQSFLNRVSTIEQVSLHCSKPPVFSHDANEEDIRVKSGRNVILKCANVESTMPVAYYWKLHDHFIDNAKGSTYTLKATVDKSGVYTCVASSLVGSVSSKGIFVDIYQPPIFMSDIEDVVYTIPDNSNASFTCNVTSSPKAKINWFYQTFDQGREPVLLHHVNVSVLEMGEVSKNDSGYYFCQAKNAHGIVTSRKAKLNVLKFMFPRQTLQLSVNVTEIMQNQTRLNLSSVHTSMLQPLADKLRVTANQMIQLMVEKSNQTLKLKFNITAINANMDDLPNLPLSTLLKVASKSRQNLANSAAVLVTLILTNQPGIMLDDNITMIKLDNKSLSHKLKLNVCAPGYQLHKNGYLCVECEAGWHSKYNSKCKKCSRGMFQPLIGKDKCFNCGESQTTADEGNINKRHCYDIDEADQFGAKEKIALIVSLSLLAIILIAVMVFIYLRRRKRVVTKLQMDSKESDDIDMEYHNATYIQSMNSLTPETYEYLEKNDSNAAETDEKQTAIDENGKKEPLSYNNHMFNED